MKHFLLFYKKGEGWENRQVGFSSAHRAHIQKYVSSGQLLLGGNLEGGEALLLFSCDSSALVSEFAEGDPYVAEGIVVDWTIRPWDTVVGTLAG